MNVYMSTRGDGVTFSVSVEDNAYIEDSNGEMKKGFWVRLTRKNEDGSEVGSIKINIGDEINYKNASGIVIDVLKDSVVLSKGDKTKKIKAVKLAEIVFPDQG